jgi:hypothetical protein
MAGVLAGGDNRPLPDGLQVAGGHPKAVAPEGLAQRRPGRHQLGGRGGIHPAEPLGQLEGALGLGPVGQEAAGLPAHRWGAAHPEPHWPPGAVGDDAVYLRAGARAAAMQIEGIQGLGAVGKTKREEARPGPACAQDGG